MQVWLVHLSLCRCKVGSKRTPYFDKSVQAGFCNIWHHRFDPHHRPSPIVVNSCIKQPIKANLIISYNETIAHGAKWDDGNARGTTAGTKYLIRNMFTIQSTKWVHLKSESSILFREQKRDDDKDIGWGRRICQERPFCMPKYPAGKHDSYNIARKNLFDLQFSPENFIK